MPAADPAPTPLLVTCLCAAWCGTCRDYRPLFLQQSRAFAAAASFRWLDIEDDDEVLGTIDVVDFPTLLIARGDEVLFYGPVTPHGQTLARLVQSALDGALPRTTDGRADGLPQRVREQLPAL